MNCQLISLSGRALYVVGLEANGASTISVAARGGVDPSALIVLVSPTPHGLVKQVLLVGNRGPSAPAFR